MCGRLIFTFPVKTLRIGEIEKLYSDIDKKTSLNDTQLDSAVKRSLTNNIYCILDIAKDKNLYPFLKFGDWHYYWFNKNWKLFENAKNEEITSTTPCLITLDPRKISVRRFLEERSGKGLLVLFESSATREEVIKHCYSLCQNEKIENEYDFRFFAPETLRAYLADCSYEEKQILLKYLDSIWVENADGSVLELSKKQDEPEVPIEPEIVKPVEKKKEKSVGVMGDWMSSLTDKKEPEADDSLGGGFGVMGEFGNSSDEKNRQ